MTLGRRRELGRQDSLMILPNVRKTGLEGNSRKLGLIPRYNRKEGAATRVRASKTILPKLGDKARIHDRLASSHTDWIVAIMLDGSSTRAGSAGEEDMYGERGLVYDGLTTDDQRRIVKADQEVSEFDAPFVISTATVSHYVVRCAQLRALGQPLLDNRGGHENPYTIQQKKEPTTTSFVNYDDVSLAGTYRIVAGRTFRGQIELGDRPARQGSIGAGVREVVQMVESPKPKATN